MRTKNSLWFALVVGLATSGAACAVDSSVDSADGAVAACEDGSEDEGCDGSHVPGEDASTDEDDARADSGSPDDDDDDDPPHVVANDAGGDGDGDDPIDEDVDPEPDAAVVAPDAGEDAEVELPRNCRDDYACGDFGTCDEALEAPTCDCVVGYSDDGSGCEWGGGVVDSQLDNPAAWSGRHMTFASGVAQFGHQGAGLACELSVLEQQLQMPTRAEAQAFVVELDVLSSCTSSDAEACPALQLELGPTSVTRLVVAGALGAASAPVARTVSACLGEAGYGPNVALRVRPALAYQHGELPLVCESAAWPAIDRIAIRPAAEGECAQSDTLLGTLTSNAGWTLGANTTVGGGSISMMPGVGRAQTVVSFGRAPATQALFVSASGAAGDYLDVSIDGLAWARVTLPSSDAPLCMPSWALGSSHRLEVAVVGIAATIRRLEIAPHAQCGDNRFDEGFDRIPAISSWTTNEGFVRPGSGYTGVGAFLTRSKSLRASERFPATAPSQRMAVQARYKRTGAQTSTLDYALDPSAGEMMTGMGWQSRTVCFPNAWERQLAGLRLDVTIMPTPAGSSVAVDLDDLGIFMVDPGACE